MIDLPNAYGGAHPRGPPTILKLHGRVDRRPERERESFLVSEDDYIGYLAQTEIASLVPVTLAARLRRSHFLFLGYALDEWTCACSCTGSGAARRSEYRSWAVEPNPGALARQYWRHRECGHVRPAASRYVEERPPAGGARERAGTISVVATIAPPVPTRALRHSRIGSSTPCASSAASASVRSSPRT